MLLEMRGATTVEIAARCEAICLGARAVVDEARLRVRQSKRQILDHEAALLYTIARRVVPPGGLVLEIGTAFGFSAVMLAHAQPLASIVTLNPNGDEFPVARANLAHLPTVAPLKIHSWDYLKAYHGPDLSLVFVDGDHKHVELDLPWFDWLTPGGMIVFHDYSPEGPKRPTPHVVEVVDKFARDLGRPPDLIVVDDGRRGVVGFERHLGEKWRHRGGQ